MDATTYLDHIRADARLLAAAARAAGPDAQVPSCPDWMVRDLLDHTADVYANRVACLRLGRRPTDDEWPKRSAESDPVAWYEERLEELVAELERHPAGEETYTFFPTDQTAGFWYRRMAQETVVHRVDAELAAGSVSPVDDALATDGVDEFLVVFLGGPWWSRVPVQDATGATYAVCTGGDRWLARLDTEAVYVTRGDGEAVATVSGDPVPLLLWLWGRESGGVRIDGDVAELRSRIGVVTG